MAQLSIPALIKALLFTTIAYIGFRVFFKSVENRGSFSFNYKFLDYFLWLVKEIFVSAMQMTKIIFLSKQSELKPVMHDLVVDSAKIKENVVYANSITLTPGTTTIKLDGDKLKIYAISKSHYSSLLKGEMYNKILGRK